MRVLIGILIFLAAEAAKAQDTRPPREAKSQNEMYVLRIDPGRPGRSSRPCQATLYKHSVRNEQGRKVWERALVNEIAPMQAFVHDDGRFVVTLDEFRFGGARHALVVYGSRGELLRHFLLPDLLTKADWEHVKVDRRQVAWLAGAECRFVEGRDEFLIRLKWGRTVRIDLRLLQVLDDQGQPIGAVAGIPIDILVELFGSNQKESERIIAERLAELADAKSEAQAPADALLDVLTPVLEPADEQPLTDDEALVTADEPLAEQLAADAMANEEPPISELTGPDAVAAEQASPLESAPDPGLEPPAESHVYAGVEIPSPDPLDKTDYVAWLNSMGVVEGPDGAPLYDAAIEQLVPWPTDSNLDRLAADGDPEALNAPEYLAWLEENAPAFDAFREGSRYPARSWERHSASGALIDVVLPDLSVMRDMARGVVGEGRVLANEDRADEAAERYLDVLAAGKHVGDAYTLIEDLVGTAMQQPAANAVLDLAADPAGEEIDFADFAAQLEAVYQPLRTSAKSMQGERAFFMDMAQQLWDVDPLTGASALNKQKTREFLRMISDVDSDAEIDAMGAEFAQTSFDETVTAGNAFYDDLTEAMSLPYPQAIEQMEQVELRVGSSENTNPVVRRTVPSLSRYHFVKTRGEATRRATLLVANIKAYQQRYGEYPESLEVFAGQDYAVDPFSDTDFIYHREGNEFVLYSLGGNLTDDGGIHDNKGDTNDLVFWPRQPK